MKLGQVLDEASSSYGDNEHDVKKMLKKNSSYKHSDLDSADYQPGSGGAGHWVVKFRDTTVHAYVAGHPLSGSNGDFEEEDKR